MISKEFLELADLTSDELSEIIVPRHDMTPWARERRLALEILLNRLRAVYQTSGRSQKYVEDLIRGSTPDKRSGKLAILVKDNNGVDNSNYRKPQK